MFNPSCSYSFSSLKQLFNTLFDQYELKNKVHVLGKVPVKDVLNVYRFLDVNIPASTMDGFDLVLFEAMAMECLVIVTHFGENPNVLEDGVNGLLFENKDIETPKKRICQVLEDQEIRNGLIKNGKRTAFEIFTMEKTVTNYEEYFQSLVTEN